VYLDDVILKHTQTLTHSIKNLETEIEEKREVEREIER
jgi:hypothetical protein